METTRTIVLKLQAKPGASGRTGRHALGFRLRLRPHRGCRPAHPHDEQGLVQRDCYREVRDTFGLSANLAIRAIARVCAALKVPERAHSAFRPTSIDYDARIFSFREWDWTVSLTLLDSRQRIETVPGEHQRRPAQGNQADRRSAGQTGRPGSSSTSRSAGEAPEPIEPDDFIGVDLGIARIATTSDDARRALRQACRGGSAASTTSNGSDSSGRARRERRRSCGGSSGKEARFRRHENHCISKSIVQSAKGTGRGIAVEDLKGIRGRITARGGDARNRLSGWSFHQLVGFLSYKAEGRGNPHRAGGPSQHQQDVLRLRALREGQPQEPGRVLVQALRVLRERRLERRPEHPGSGQQVRRP